MRRVTPPEGEPWCAAENPPPQKRILCELRIETRETARGKLAAIGFENTPSARKLVTFDITPSAPNSRSLSATVHRSRSPFYQKNGVVLKKRRSHQNDRLELHCTEVTVHTILFNIFPPDFHVNAKGVSTR